MDTLTQDRNLIEQLLNAHQQSVNSNNDIAYEVVFDREHDRYLLLSVGWQGGRRVHYCLIHVDILDGKFWIQKDNTEYGIGNQLLEAGVEKDRIVPAFYHISHRQNMEYAVG
jgi:hypothetical protein